MKIYVVAHKDYDRIVSEPYETIRVGKNNPTDNTGDNISDRNNQFCELTAQYWIWKNDTKSDITGLVHYRRYFLEPSFPKKSLEKNILGEKSIVSILSEYDIIIPELAHKTKDNFWLYKDGRTSSGYLQTLRKAVEETDPAFLPAFDRVAFGNRISFGNMIIASKPVFDGYCSWLFKVLDAYEKLFEGELPPRHLGYMAEYLLNTYVWGKGLKAKYLRVVNTEGNSPAYIKAKMTLSKLGIFDLIVGVWYFFYEQTKLRKRT